MKFNYRETYPLGEDKTNYHLLTDKYVSVIEVDGKNFLKVAPEGLRELARQALHDISFLMRGEHNEMVAKILNDPEASVNDKAVAATMLLNAKISAEGILPFCQDTGTAIVVAKKGERVLTGADDKEWLSHGIFDTYTQDNLRYSQTVPLDMYREVNSGTNLPAQIDIYSTQGDEYSFLFVAKGGGSANKTFLFQETKALLNPASLESFIAEKMKLFGTSACPPYHMAIVIGGTSAEECMKVVKLASTKYLDSLPTQGGEEGHAFRDLEMEGKVLKMAQKLGVGAQFGGKYFAHDVRVIRLPRHGASCPVGIGVSCSADRNIKAKINRDGIWLESLDREPGRLLPEKYKNPEAITHAGVKIDLNREMKEILKELSKYPVSTLLLLSGTIIVARDSAHAKLKERLDAGKGLPQYVKDHPIYYAGPAKTPKGYASGSFGPTTAGRMDSYVRLFQESGGSLIMIAKGNRSKDVTASCKEYGGFYLGSIGGPAAILAQENIKKVELLEYPELGMEAIWKVEVKNFPAFILVDDKGNDFFAKLL
ncbi:MAG: fumarate hydratase [Bacteroidales bacterium]